MKLLHLLRKAVFRSRMDGIKDMLRELIYVNRTMIVIEKDIRESRSAPEKGLRFMVVDSANLKELAGRGEWRIVSHYCSRGARCVLAYRGDDLVGYQFYTRKNSFRDLRRIGVTMGKDEAYLFDLFVFPEQRGTDVPRIITAWTFRHLVSEGVDKIYGFYYSDNIRSLWWHRAVLKCKELKRVKANRILIFEWTDGRMAANS